ncbi:hypothetical protein GOP47_0011275 [Adiantum capillus-veneris]|uniref:Non-haem dioxygenase N-terminal domain-containing protein n=1 Tax=Adiantum capillus-veneris TaxID=13818 RepID=A0A9D4USX3_ADICA|nr:hypothetical protein GOP47_0011275 [Adiantum capillus-veneris]
MAGYALPVSENVVSIPLSSLQDKNIDLSRELEAGFGPGGLGIVAISEVPDYASLRHHLLHLGERLAALPEQVRENLEDPDSRYSFGWSHGKENLESGVPDVLKGSFYANPLVDIPTLDEEPLQRYPSFCRPNKWPKKDLPELEQALKALGRLMLDVGLLVAHHCDKYVESKCSTAEGDKLEDLLRNSQYHKGRLLHYFPSLTSSVTERLESTSSWCGWHTDHGSLTGLTCAMYMRNGIEIRCPDKIAGLYVRTLNGEIKKAVFSENQIAYQMGETTEILSKGLLRATPHCVQASAGANAVGVTRNTFALFMQPCWDQPLQIIHEQSDCTEKVINFGDFSEKTISKYYKNVMV